MKSFFFALPGNAELARRLANLVPGAMGALEMRHFPDGETYLRFVDDLQGTDVVLVCTLDRPDDKIAPLLFAAKAAHALGAKRVGLVAPYLCYMRQDRQFKAGEAVTSRSFANLLSSAFDWLVTVDPHLHRYHGLADIYSMPAKALHSGPAIAAWVRKNVAHPYLIGPDSESRQWVEAVARDCGASWIVAHKTRQGDREVREEPLAVSLPQEATPVLLDDIVSSGETLLKALTLLKWSDGHSPVAMAIHGLCDVNTEKALREAGARLITTNSVPNPWAQIDVTPLIARGVSEFLCPSS